MSVFETLAKINVNNHTEKKNGLTYLSWAWAWATVKQYYPSANYTIYENTLPDGYTVNYYTDGYTAWVKTGVEIEGQEYIEMLPVMDYKNKSIPIEMLTSFDVNKAIQRSLTKAVARHGLGLYIYAGEDLPEEPMTISFNRLICENCNKPITAVIGKDGQEMTAQEISKTTKAKFKKCLCAECAKGEKENRNGK